MQLNVAFFFKYKNVRLNNAFHVIFDQFNASFLNKYSLKLIISIGKNAYHTLYIHIYAVPEEVRGQEPDWHHFEQETPQPLDLQETHGKNKWMCPAASVSPIKKLQPYCVSTHRSPSL